MWKTPLLLDKYLYARTNPFGVRLLGILGIGTTLLMGYGLLQFVQLKLLYVLVFGPIIGVFVINKLLRFGLQLFYQKFDIKKHEIFVKEYWANNSEPSVDVFLPYAGEDLAVHEEVVKAVKMLDYNNLNVYMLDDAGNEEHRLLAEKYRFNYLSRPNKGLYKKSGNLQYGYDHSKGEFVFILDADFIPTTTSLKDLIPYIATDNSIGILQTPQFFEQNGSVHKRSRIEFGGGNIVEDFYRIVMPCRDEFRAAMCVGTSAIYRRKTILCLNSTPKVHASEDLATGLLITKFGYYVKYLPLIVSMGTSPQTFQGYFKQHLRWCSGNLVFARYWPGARLSVMARLIYATNPLYYISEALTVVFSFQFLALLYFHTDSLSLNNTLYFLPYIILSRLIIPQTKKNKNKLGTKLAALSNSYTYFYTYIRMAIKGVPNWHPTGVKIAGLTDDFLEAFNLGSVISSLFIICFLFVLISKPEIFGNYNTYIVLAWAFYSVFWHVLFLSFVLRYIHPFRLMKISSSPAKTLVYAKTYSVWALFVLLIFSTVVGTFGASLDPKSPTTIALNNFWARPNKTAVIAKTAQVVKRKTAVLGVATSGASLDAYVLTVEMGDTLMNLAQESISSLSGEIKVPISDDQLRYASTIVINTTHRSELIKPGQTIRFEKIELLAALEEAVARKD